jgi:protein TonB
MNTVPQQAGAFRIGRTRAKQSTFERIIGIGLAAAVEAGFVYALLVGLGFVPMPPMIPHTDFFNVPSDDPNRPVPPPLPPTIPTPKIPETIPTEITIDIPQDVPRNPITLPSVPTTPQPQPPVGPVASVEPRPPITLSPAHALLATHTTPDYPPLSRRLGEQGTLRLKLTITVQGAVADAMVVNSSGHPRLDEAAVSWVKTHWRYQPAMRGATPVPSTADAVVTFKLQ